MYGRLTHLNAPAALREPIIKNRNAERGIAGDEYLDCGDDSFSDLIIEKNEQVTQQ
jgi:hypothetical protein